MSRPRARPRAWACVGLVVLASASLADARPRRAAVPKGAPETTDAEAEAEADAADAEAQLEDAAEDYLERGEADKAVQIYDQLLVDRPDDAGLLDGLLDACVASAPCHPRLAMVLAQAEVTAAGREEIVDRAATALCAAGWRGPAADAMRRYVGRQPENLEIWRACGEHLVETGGAARALVDLERSSRGRALGPRVLELELAAAAGPARLDAALASTVRDLPWFVDAWVMVTERALERGDLAGARRSVARARASTPVSPAMRARIVELQREIDATKGERRREFRMEVRFSDHQDDVEPGSDY